jgi:cutinase
MQLLILLCALGATTLALPIPSAVGLTEMGHAKRQSNPINQLLALITQLFPVNILVTDLEDLITTAEVGLAAVTGIDTTKNDLASNRCADMTIVFARGTTEAGNVGVLVGPPFFDAVKKRMTGSASLAVQGVNYPADVAGFLERGDKGGGQRM